MEAWQWAETNFLSIFFHALALIYFLQLWTFVSFMSCTSSELHLAIIALDRYLAISRPDTYAHTRSYKKSLMMLVVVWISSFVIVGPPFLFNWGITWPTAFDNDTPCTIPQVFAFDLFPYSTLLYCSSENGCVLT